MLDFGLPELLLIIAIAVLAIGPEQVPSIMYRFGKFIQRMRGFQFAMSRHFDNFMDDYDTKKSQNTAGSDTADASESEDALAKARAEAEADEDEAYISPPNDQNAQTPDLFGDADDHNSEGKGDKS